MKTIVYDLDMQGQAIDDADDDDDDASAAAAADDDDYGPYIKYITLFLTNFDPLSTGASIPP